MKVGDVWYLKADNSKYIITGFAKDVYPDDVAVLFNTGDMVDSFTLLNSNLFTKAILRSSKEDNTTEMNNLKLQLLRDISTLPIKDKLYWTKQIESCLDIKLAQSLVEGLKKQLVINSELEQESYDGQHAEEAYWDDNDLVPNPGERKRFKLF